MINTIFETSELIKKIDIADRFGRGMPGEYTGTAALKLNIIPNAGHGWGTTVESKLFSKKWEDEVMSQRKNGDLWFINSKNEYTIEYIDMKNVAWVSQDSLRDFRPDGWFFFNAWYRPSDEDYKLGRRSCIHFMVKACREFKDFVTENVDPTRRGKNGKLGYEISFTDMKPEWLNNEFDADAYSKLMKAVWDECDYWKMLEDVRNRKRSNSGYGSDPQ